MFCRIRHDGGNFARTKRATLTKSRSGLGPCDGRMPAANVSTQEDSSSSSAMSRRSINARTNPANSEREWAKAMMPRSLKSRLRLLEFQVGAVRAKCIVVR